MDIIANPQAYVVLRLLRTAIVTKNDLEKLKKMGADDIDDALKMLWENQMIQVFRDDRNNKYYALLSDFHISLVFPKYLLNIIKSEYDKKSKANQYVNVLFINVYPMGNIKYKIFDYYFNLILYNKKDENR